MGKHCWASAERKTWQYFKQGMPAPVLLSFLHTCKYTQAFMPLLFTCSILFHKKHSTHPKQSFTASQILRFLAEALAPCSNFFRGTGIGKDSQKLGSWRHQYAAKQWAIRREESTASRHTWGSGGSVCSSGPVCCHNWWTLVQDPSHNISTALAQMSSWGEGGGTKGTYVFSPMQPYSPG